MVTDDYSNTFHQLRSQLTHVDGRSYVTYVRSLDADYARVRRDVALGYLALLAVCLGAVVAARYAVTPVLSVPIAALLIGYWIAYLQLFIHEGAHFNLASARDASDRFCDRFISWMVGTSVRQYRRVHFQHHRAIGTVDDSEFTYFFPLNLKFILKGLFGIRAFEVAVARRQYVQSAEETKKKSRPPDEDRESLWPLLVGIAGHGVIVLAMWFAGGVPAALSWVLGVGMFFPFFGALRQLLEHRRDDASADTDYMKQDHGAFTRVFNESAFAKTFGGAGFNRHLLHHWEPQVSYTRLPDLERFLLQTELGPVIETRRTTYWATFRNVFGASGHPTQDQAS